ncbi:MAG: TrkA family potassium uptake protein [Caldilineaceae bacterium]|nr:TrkA family potassium uptake protein [Caldilinea sp.]MCB9114384.1 TrkA family potassium uptake protein [Caldilineaceae bacterium]MCB9119563.1 TrkA family potassium uptake protein [Caldilineaceae bacterium]HRW48237.1 TrkA family potassium uptake protein [Caldilinea sp.]
MPFKGNQREFVVIGLGEFGASVARRLHELGHGVMGVDRSRAIVQQLADDLPDVVVLDATDEDALRDIDIQSFDTALVAVGTDLARAILITLALKEMGVRYVISKALDDHAKQVLLRIGADEVVMPEFQFGRWVAERMVLGSIKAIQEVEPGVLLGAIDCPAEVAGRSLEELNLPKAITVLLVTGGDRTTPMPPPTLRLVAGDTIWLMGDANAFHAIRAFKQQTQ